MTESQGALMSKEKNDLQGTLSRNNNTRMKQGKSSEPIENSMTMRVITKNQKQDTRLAEN